MTGYRNYTYENVGKIIEEVVDLTQTTLCDCGKYWEIGQMTEHEISELSDFLNVQRISYTIKVGSDNSVRIGSIN